MYIYIYIHMYAKGIFGYEQLPNFTFLYGSKEADIGYAHQNATENCDGGGGVLRVSPKPRQLGMNMDHGSYSSIFIRLFAPGVTFEGFVCRVKENAVGAWVQLGTSSGCEQGLMAMTNPHVSWRLPATRFLRLVEFWSLVGFTACSRKHVSFSRGSTDCQGLESKPNF